MRRFFKSDSGAVMVFVAFALPVLLLSVAWVIDFGIARIAKNRLQIAADAAALAGAANLPDEADVRSAARQLAAANYGDEAALGSVLRSEDVEVGNWDVASRVFETDGEPVNAVRVTTRRDDTNSNPLQTYFAMMAGIDDFQLSQSAIAHVGAGEGCRAGGFFSEENVESGSNNTYLGGFCLYGAKGVKIGSDNAFAENSEITMNRLSDFEQGGSNSGTKDALRKAEYELALPNKVPDILKFLRGKNENYELPPFITKGPIKLNEINDSTELQEGTLYIVNDVADFGSDKTIRNIAVVAKKEVKVGSNNTMENVVFASDDKVLFGSNNSIGGSDYCDTGIYNTYLFSRDNIEFGSNNDLNGVQIAGRGELKLGSDVTGVKGVLAEVTGKIDYGSADTWGSCEQSLGSHFGLPVYPSAATSLVLVR